MELTESSADGELLDLTTVRCWPPHCSCWPPHCSSCQTTIKLLAVIVLLAGLVALVVVVAAVARVGVLVTLVVIVVATAVVRLAGPRLVVVLHCV